MKRNNHERTNQLMTRWADFLDKENVLPEYPRPQLVRKYWQNLNGLWNYAIRPIGDPVENYDGKIVVPFPLESSLSGVEKPLYPDEILWYYTSFHLEEEHLKGRVLLHFGAVDWKMTLWINGNKVGEHSGGYNPFNFDITNTVRQGENNIKISVWDPTDSDYEQRGKQTLQPDGIFYTAISGIWQTVWLEFVPKQYIESIKLTPNIDDETISISVNTNVVTSNTRYEVIIYNDQETIVTGNAPIDKLLTLSIPNPKLWSPDSPYLYDVKIKLVVGETIDIVDSYFGMRKFSIERDNSGKKRLCLNNQFVFQHGVLDQGYWPDGLYTAPTDEALQYDIIAAKELGFNMIRKHIKVEPARWYYHCDRQGMIVWQDMINGGSGWKNLYHLIIPNLLRNIHLKDTKKKFHQNLGRNDKANQLQFKKELKEMIDALYNVTSIAMWIPFNEGWGQFNAEEIYEWVKEYDPTRYANHVSGWYDQRVSDIKSLHIYFRKLAMPKHILDRAVVISEYGGYRLPVKGHVFKKAKNFGYREYKSAEDFLIAYEKLMNEQLKPLIEQGISAAVYTQLIDVEGEVNGLLTYDREKVKIDKKKIQSLHLSIINDKT